MVASLEVPGNAAGRAGDWADRVAVTTRRGASVMTCFMAVWA